MTLVDRLLATVMSGATAASARVVDVRVGTHWTIVVIEMGEPAPAPLPLPPPPTPPKLGGRGAGGGGRERPLLRAGLASTQIMHDLEHGRPAVRDAGRLIGKPAIELAGLAGSASLTERSIGFAAINALLEVDEAACVDVNAEELILRGGVSRRVAIVGHFPFVPRVREVAETCWVLELNPGEGDLPAERAPEIIPQADVVAITGMTLVNGTFEELATLCRPDAHVIVLGATTPLTPLLFEYGVDAISGAILTDIPAAVAAVSQGANFRQIPGKRLVTMTRG